MDQKAAEQAVQNAGDAANGIWQFLLDKPLKIAIIIVAGIILNVILRLIIRRVMNHIAEGDAAKLDNEVGPDESEPHQAEETKRWLIQDSPIARARRAQRAKTVGSVLRSVSTIVITAIVALTVLSELGINMAPIIASAGVVGVALGFGAQALVKDYLSGIFMVAEDQYGIGDYVDLGDASGEVENVGLRVTQLRDLDGTLWHVRNGEVLRVGNFSQGWARSVLDIPVPYNSDISEVSDLLLQTAKAMRKERQWRRLILDEPEVWGIQALTGESITIRLVLRTKPLEQWGIAREMRARLKTQLDNAGIVIPLMNQTVIKNGRTAAVAGGDGENEDPGDAPLGPTS
ncbi:mechanosensitive ion channel family protein [Arthrobacter castelli]|uniref:mechanosensitive ion channel family protein n=1 Tax=Arthrobacter castelli TaxID=271431 RepID=UPI0006860A79|nr:mechanosensitive ion channel family protein [Arthrobacter castelli]